MLCPHHTPQRSSLLSSTVMQLTPKDLVLEPYRGGLALTGPSLQSAIPRFLPFPLILSKPLHITLVTATEYKSISRPDPSLVHIPTDHIYIVGLAASCRHEREVRWLVILWNHADQWRRSMDLEKKDYHITLSEDDDHELSKGIGSLLRATSREKLVASI